MAVHVSFHWLGIGEEYTGVFNANVSESGRAKTNWGTAYEWSLSVDRRWHVSFLSLCDNGQRFAPGYGPWVSLDLMRLEVENLKTIQADCTWEGDIGLSYNNGQASGSPNYEFNSPFSKTLPKSTLTRSKVWPCDLWMLIAHERISGSWNTSPLTIYVQAGRKRGRTCNLDACTSPLGSSILNVSGMTSTLLCDPLAIKKSTSGYFFATPRAAAFFVLVPVPPRVLVPEIASACSFAYSAGSTKEWTLPILPFTSVSSVFLISMTCAPIRNLRCRTARKFSRSFSRACCIADPPSTAVYSCSSTPTRPAMRRWLEESTSERIGNLNEEVSIPIVSHRREHWQFCWFHPIWVMDRPRQCLKVPNRLRGQFSEPHLVQNADKFCARVSFITIGLQKWRTHSRLSDGKPVWGYTCWVRTLSSAEPRMQTLHRLSSWPAEVGRNHQW